jgi:hypothetical protein
MPSFGTSTRRQAWAYRIDSVIAANVRLKAVPGHLPPKAISNLVKASTPEQIPSLASQLRSQLKTRLQSLIKLG